MKRIKLTIVAILIAMYQIDLGEGFIKLIGWLAFAGLFIALVAQLEARYVSAK